MSTRKPNTTGKRYKQELCLFIDDEDAEEEEEYGAQVELEDEDDSEDATRDSERSEHSLQERLETALSQKDDQRVRDIQKALATKTIEALEEPWPVDTTTILSLHPETKQRDVRILAQGLEQLLTPEAGEGDDPTSLHVAYGFMGGRASGRLRARGPSLQLLSRRCRNALAKAMDLEDIDIRNCNPELLVQWCKLNDISCPRLEDYVTNREDMLAEVMDACSVSRGKAKKLFLKLLNGGSLEWWREKHPTGRGKSFPSFVVSYGKEAECLMDAVWERNPQLHGEAKAPRPDGQDRRNPKATLLSFILQDMETQCCRSMLRFFRMHGWVVVCLIYDGLMVRRRREIPINQDALTQCEVFVRERTGWTIGLVSKPLGDPLPLNPFFTLASRFPGTFIQDSAQYASELARPHTGGQRLMVIRSPPGSGKTRFSKGMVQRDQEFEGGDPRRKRLLCSPRCAVTREHEAQFGELGFIHYRDRGAHQTKQVITTLDSLPKFVRNSDLVSHVFCYFDEFEYGLGHLFSSTIAPRRKQVWQTLMSILAHGDKVLLTDADCGDLTVVTLSHVSSALVQDDPGVSPESDMIFLENTKLLNQKRIEFVPCRRMWYQELERCLLEPGSKVFIGTDSASDARLIREQVLRWRELHLPDYSHLFSPEDVLIYTAEDGDDRDLLNVNEKWAGSRKVIICSPKVTNAVNYDNEEDPFTAVMLLYTRHGETLDAIGGAQQARRCRRITAPRSRSWDICVFVADSGRKWKRAWASRRFPTDVEVIKEELNVLVGAFYDMSRRLSDTSIIGDLPHTVDALGRVQLHVDDPFVDLYAHFIRMRNISKRGLKEALELLFRIRGHQVSHVPVEDLPKHDIWGDRSLISEWNDRRDRLFEDLFDERVAFQSCDEKECRTLLLEMGCSDTTRAAEASKTFVRARRVLHEVLFIPVDPETITFCKETEILRAFLTNDKELKRHQRFRWLMRSRDAGMIGARDHDFAVMFMTQSDQTVLRVLDELERNVLHVKRFECLEWDIHRVRRAYLKRLNSIPGDLKQIIQKMGMFELAQKLRLSSQDLKTEYDAYKWICSVYREFSPHRLITTKHDQCRTLQAPRRDSFPVKRGHQRCTICQRDRKPREFFDRKRKECRHCRKRIPLFSLCRESSTVIQDHLEIMVFTATHAGAGDLRRLLRFDEPILSGGGGDGGGVDLSSPTRFHTAWKMPAVTLAELLTTNSRCAFSEEDGDEGNECADSEMDSAPPEFFSVEDVESESADPSSSDGEYLPCLEHLGDDELLCFCDHCIQRRPAECSCHVRVCPHCKDKRPYNSLGCSYIKFSVHAPCVGGACYKPMPEEPWVLCDVCR